LLAVDLELLILIIHHEPGDIGKGDHHKSHIVKDPEPVLIMEHQQVDLIHKVHQCGNGHTFISMESGHEQDHRQFVDPFVSLLEIGDFDEVVFTNFVSTVGFVEVREHFVHLVDFDQTPGFGDIGEVIGQFGVLEGHEFGIC